MGSFYFDLPEGWAKYSIHVNFFEFYLLLTN